MKIDLKVTDMIVVSIMDKHTGLYQNMLVTNSPRWKHDSIQINKDDLVCIEVLPIGLLDNNNLTFHSLEEFEDAINI